MSRILIIEDEIAISRMLSLNLTVTGYETVSLMDGEEVLNWLQADGRAELALVDVMLPKHDGFELLDPLLAHGIPVIFLTARGDIESKLRGLTGGAEDYIVKPFEMLEVLARIDKVLKRQKKERGQGDGQEQEQEQEVYQLGGIELDVQKRIVRREGEEVLLTPIEFDLLLYLAQNRNIALRRERLLDEVWNINYEGGTRTVDVHIAQLRRKTGLNIVSVPKIGYRLEEK